MANQAKWAALPDNLKSVIKSAVAELEKASFDFSGDIKGEAEAREKLKAQGVTFHDDMSAADKQAIRSAAMKTWDLIAKETKSSENQAKIMKMMGLKN